MKHRRMLYLLFVLVAFTASLMAQSASTASITGTVVDPQGAVVSGAKVTATNQSTGVGRSVNTTTSGNYAIPSLPPGTYTVRVEARGFAPGETKNIMLNVGDQRDLSMKLTVAGSQESIEVTTAAPLIESTKTDVSTTVTNLDMERLPTFAGSAVIGGAVNDYAQLALTAPGVKSDTSGLTTGDLIAPGSTNNRGNLYNVDGANITDQLVSGRDTTGASVDEVQEFQVITNNYNAEYGQATGLVLNAVTKSGTNDVHGEGHAYFRGRNLAASDPFFNLGFLDPVTGLVNNTACPHFGTTDISGCPRAPFHRAEGGFTAGGPFIKNKLFWFASYEISRQELPLILTPFGQSQIAPQPVNNLLYSGKIDYKISDNHTFTARYAVDRLRISNQIVQTGANVSVDDLTAQTINNASVNASVVSNLTPTMVNEARFVFFRFINTLTNNTTVPGVIHPDGTQTGADFCCPQGGLQKRYQYIDNLTWTRAKHTMKFGFNISYYPWNSLFQQFHFGQYTLDSNGTPTSFTFGTGPGSVTSKDNIYGFYAQDTWKATPKLTLNIGLRYDFEAGAFKGGPIHGPNGSCFQANGLIPACSRDPNNFQPRIGFTYAITDKTLFHAAGAETTMLAFNNVVLDSLNFDGVTLNTASTTDPAVLAFFPNAPPASLLSGSVVCPPDCGRVRPISTHLRNPEMRSANAGIEHQFTKTLKAEVQYIGQWGFGLFGERDVNAPPLLADPAHPGFFFYGPRPNQTFTAIRTNENSRTSHYNGLLISAEQRMTNHVQFNASYTWSHTLTSSEDFFGISEPADYVNIRQELGPAYNDIRHAVNMGVVLDSGKTWSGFLGTIANNLSLSWLGQIQSARPYPLSTGSSQFGNGSRFFGSGSETQQRPNVLSDGTVSVAGIGTFDGFAANFSPASIPICTAGGFTLAQCAAIVNTFPAPAAADPHGPIDALAGIPVDFQLRSGNVERNAARGDPFLRFDASLNKTIGIPGHENIRIELRFDAFNVFNNTNYNSFNSNDVLTAMPLSTTTDANGNIIAAAPNFFTCTGCQRPNGTFVGLNGQTLHLNDLRQGRVSSSLLASQRIFNGLGDPGANDLNSIGSRKLQLSFHVRF